MHMKKTLIIVSIVVVIILVILGILKFSGDRSTQELPIEAASIANPASEFCISLGGELEEFTTEGGVSNYCMLPSGEKCEEWALFRSECGVTQEIPTTDISEVPMDEVTL